MSGVLRTGNYFLSDHDGRFHVTGTRYAIDHKIYLNITHHCIPTAKRDIHKVSFHLLKHFFNISILINLFQNSILIKVNKLVYKLIRINF